MGKKLDEGRLRNVAIAAEDAFWEEVVKQLPEIETGDLDPITCVRLSEMMKDAIKEWYATNYGNKR